MPSIDLRRRLLVLPTDHSPAMEVPFGGSCCANCKFYHAAFSSLAPYGRCGQPDYATFYGTDVIPTDPRSYCSDWYDWNR
jgi:hypothetical protein